MGKVCSSHRTPLRLLASTHTPTHMRVLMFCFKVCAAFREHARALVRTVSRRTVWITHFDGNSINPTLSHTHTHTRADTKGHNTNGTRGACEHSASTTRAITRKTSLENRTERDRPGVRACVHRHRSIGRLTLPRRASRICGQVRERARRARAFACLLNMRARAHASPECAAKPTKTNK